MRTKHFAPAALLAFGLTAGAAWAQAPDTATGLVPAGGSVVGGGIATMTGSGDDALITYSAAGAGGGGGAVPGQAGRLASFAGSDGEGKPRWAYASPSQGGAGTGREAWVTGAGDDAQVVYGPRRR